MYVCQTCGHVSEPKEKRKVYTLYRVVRSPFGKECRQVEREVPVCARCKRMLEGGMSLDELQEHLDLVRGTDMDVVPTREEQEAELLKTRVGPFGRLKTPGRL